MVSLKRAAVGVAFMALAGLLTVVAIGILLRPRSDTAVVAPAVPDQQQAQPASTVPSPQPESMSAAPPVERQIDVKGFGRVTTYSPSAPTSRAVIYITAAGGVSAADSDPAQQIASHGTLVALLSFDAMKRAQGTVRCWFPAGVLEEIAKSVEGQLDWPEYRVPVVAGREAGASLAYASLVQAPAGTFAGGIGLQFSGVLPTNRPVCGTRDWKPVFDDAKHSDRLPQVTTRALPWRDLGAGPVDDTAVDRALSELFAANDAPVVKAAPPTASAAQLEQRLAALKLSLDDTWAEHPKATLIFMSGDGGWRDIDQHLGAYLAARGVNVIGLSSAVYLWKAKTPPQGGADLKRMADVVDDAEVPVLMGGYSIGAEVVPFFLDAWTPEDRKKVAGQILIAPSATATFEWSFSSLDWVPFHKTKETAYRVADAIRRDAVPVFCLTGTQVTPGGTACSSIADIGTIVKLPGDHHFNGNYDGIGAAALAFINQVLQRGR